MRMAFGKSLHMKVTEECPICLIDFVTGAQIAQLACFNSHMMHWNCYEAWLDQSKSNGRQCTCPECRKPIDEAAVEKRVFKLDLKNVDEKIVRKLTLKRNASDDSSPAKVFELSEVKNSEEPQVS